MIYLKMKKIITTSEKETLEFAGNMAEKIKTGKVFALLGDLGAGKTVFVRGFLRGLGYKGRVNSPTFVIMKIYDIKKNPQIKQVCHIDAYRLKSAADLEAIGALEYFKRKDTVVFVEWAERISKLLLKNTSYIHIESQKENTRVLKIKKGPKK
ncbi:tRNA (adenosine(37)-N6)-threonylcarbamoyltransferase complex ATPase subunit type 1 TsaE [Candidatus Falkowbacteria bacterium]|nr:tRNA (adenosine(37)-N6)-threonylcarbamoyltransferase complex ATPase subunit type 1 TsaE [Candidatus Falkowbacteria bacterium]